MMGDSVDSVPGPLVKGTSPFGIPVLGVILECYNPNQGYNFSTL